MKKLITAEQKHEIEQLASEHHDALIAYGADMYRSGMCKGAIVAVSGMVIGGLIMFTVKSVKNKSTNEEES